MGHIKNPVLFLALTLAVIASAVLPTPASAGGVNPNGWMISTYEGATDQMVEWANSMLELAPEQWPTFPNVDNSAADDFLAKDGLEYGMAESSYCQQDETCDIVVPAMHYRIITGDYAIDEIGQCEGSVDDMGCALMIVNVGVVTASFEDASVDSGFTVWGRYWNGDAMPTAIWAGLSHASANMLNMNSPLNPNGTANAGANCSSPNGCEQVHARFAIISGNEVLVVGQMTVDG